LVKANSKMGYALRSSKLFTLGNWFDAPTGLRLPHARLSWQRLPVYPQDGSPFHVALLAGAAVLYRNTIYFLPARARATLGIQEKGSRTETFFSAHL
jgi:hypothetical protein